MGHVVIEGTITTVGPLSIRMPDADEHGGFPVMSRGVDDEGQPMKTGYLPATTLRGFLRRAVVTRNMREAKDNEGVWGVLRQLGIVVTRDMREAKDNGKPYSLQKAYAELIGQDAESEQQAGEIDLLAIKKMRDESPVIDLFGSGLSVASRLRVGHFVPERNVLPESYPGVRKDLGDTEGVVELLSASDAERYHGREEANNRRAGAEKVVKTIEGKIRKAGSKDESVEALRRELEEAEKVLEKHKEEMGAMQVSSRTLVSHTALPAGLDLRGRIVILNAKERDREMIEFGLDCLSRSPVLGAQSARGCGEISGIFKVMIEVPAQRLPRRLHSSHHGNRWLLKHAQGRTDEAGNSSHHGNRWLLKRATRTQRAQVHSSHHGNRWLLKPRRAIPTFPSYSSHHGNRWLLKRDGAGVVRRRHSSHHGNRWLLKPRR